MDLPTKRLYTRGDASSMAEERLPNRIYPIDSRSKETVTVKKRFRKIGQDYDPKTAPVVENVYTFPVNENFGLPEIRRKGMVEIDLPERDPAGFEEMKRLAREEVEAEIAAEKQAPAVESEPPPEPTSAAEEVEMEVGTPSPKTKMKRGQPRKS